MIACMDITGYQKIRAQSQYIDSLETSYTCSIRK